MTEPAFLGEGGKKIVVIGDTNVGKTTMVTKLM